MIEKLENALVVRLEFEAKTGSDKVKLQLLPNEVVMLMQEGIECKSAGGSYYWISWDETFGNILMTTMKELISSYEPRNLAERLALATTEALLNE